MKKKGKYNDYEVDDDDPNSDRQKEMSLQDFLLMVKQKAQLHREINEEYYENKWVLPHSPTTSFLSLFLYLPTYLSSYLPLSLSLSLSLSLFIYIYIYIYI